MRRTALVCAGVVAAGFAVMPLDASIGAWALGLERRGDLWRELGVLHQYGQGGAMLLGMALVWSLDPSRCRRLLDWLLAAGLVWLAVFTTKALVGRPRPRLGDPYGFLWPWGTWDFGGTVGERHAWEIRAVWTSDLWSMPSNHAAMAAVMSVFLIALYPALRWFGLAMLGLVGAGRVLFGAHYPSDVLIGAGMGWLIATVAVRGLWGVRALDWLWVRAVDRDADPAWPAVAEAERARRRARERAGEAG